jgi:hypothetical protein
MNDDYKAKGLLLCSFLFLLVAAAAEIEKEDSDNAEYIKLYLRLRRRRQKKFFPRYRAPQLLRKTWDEFRESIDDTTFRRMFRMSKESFSELCENICNTVSEENFRPESFLCSGEYLPQLVAANQYHGGFISGELKMAITIRMLAGASYLDLIFGFSISRSTLYREFDNVIQWINQTFQFSIYSHRPSKIHYVGDQEDKSMIPSYVVNHNNRACQTWFRFLRRCASKKPEEVLFYTLALSNSPKVFEATPNHGSSNLVL